MLDGKLQKKGIYLQNGENRNVGVDAVVRRVWCINVLSGHERGKKVAVGSDGDALRVDQRNRDPIVAEDESAVPPVLVQFI